jgi:imidazolonepropionase-like amidohydrolase
VVAVHAEATALQRHGFSAAEVLRAATTGSCAALGITDRGVLAPGCRADVVAFAGTLETDLTGLATPRLVVQAGVVLLPDLTSS